MSLRKLILTAMDRYTPPNGRKRTGPVAKVGSRYAISKATGIDQSSLSRFANGETNLSMDNLERLLDALNLQVQPKT